MLRTASRPLASSISRRSSLGLTFAAGATATAAAITSGYLEAPDSESVRGLQRQATFWRRVVPVISAYYWNFGSSSPKVRLEKWFDQQQNVVQSTQLEGSVAVVDDNVLTERQQRLNEYHEKYAPEILQVMLDLKGLFIKLGQVLSVTALPIPDAYRERFRTLQNDVPGWQEFDEIQQILNKELGKPWTDIFASIHPIPCGAASIGQAHKAKLLRDDQEVIIKVQYKDAAWKVPADIQCVGDLMKFCVWAGVLDETAATLSFDEFSRQFLAELDYSAEQGNLEAIFQSSLSPSSPYKARNVVVPASYPEFCTPKVITMTYLPGPKLEEEALRRLQSMGIDTKKGLKGIMLRDAAKDVTSAGESKPDQDAQTGSPQSSTATTSWKQRLATSILSVDGLLRLTRWWQRVLWGSTSLTVSTIRAFPSVLTPDSLREWADSREVAVGQVQRLALTEDWMDALFDVHGHQIFQLGIFNADVHPGNILVVEREGDKNPSQLGLIDFGQCKHLEAEEQVRIAKLLLSVADNESDDQIAAAFRNLNIETQNDSTEFLASFAKLLFGPFRPEHTSHAWHRELHALDRVTYFPNELSMVYRCSLLLRGLAISLQVNPSICEQWRKHAQQAIRDHQQ